MYMTPPNTEVNASMMGRKRTLDDFFTRPEIAVRCKKHLMDAMDKYGINVSRKVFIEPSAGDGTFYDLMPPTRRRGYDIEPKRKDIIKQNFFQFNPDPKDVDRGRSSA